MRDRLPKTGHPLWVNRAVRARARRLPPLWVGSELFEDLVLRRRLPILSRRDSERTRSLTSRFRVLNWRGAKLRGGVPAEDAPSHASFRKHPRIIIDSHIAVGLGFFH